MKPTITASIQYWERTASLALVVDRERAVMREGQGRHVARDDEADLPVPGGVRADHAVVDLAVRGPEEVGAVAERVGGEEAIAWPWKSSSVR